MRKFKDIIFMGNEDSSNKCTKLHNRLEEALTTLSLIQQPSHPQSDKEYEEDCRMMKRFHGNIEDAVRDIAVALTGKNIDFKDTSEGL